MRYSVLHKTTLIVMVSIAWPGTSHALDVDNLRSAHAIIQSQSPLGGAFRRQMENDNGELELDRTAQLKKLGDRMLVEFKYPVSNDAGVACVTSTVQFQLSGQESSYRVVAVERASEQLQETKSGRLLWDIAAPWMNLTHLYREPIADIAEGCSENIACTEVKSEGQEYSVTWDQRPFGGRLYGKLFLDPERMYLPIRNQYFNSRNGIEIEHSFDYDSASDVPRSVKQTVRYRSGTSPWQIESIESFDVSPDLSIAKDEFSLSHYGIPDSMGEKRFNWTLWIFLGFVIPALLIYWLRLSRLTKNT